MSLATFRLIIARQIQARRDDRAPTRAGRDVPTGADGLKGVAFVEAVVGCHKAAELRWITPAFVRSEG